MLSLIRQELTSFFALKMLKIKTPKIFNDEKIQK